MSHILNPKIVFTVNLLDLQFVQSFPQPDSLRNIELGLRATTIQVPGVNGNLRHGDTFTLYGQQALYVKDLLSQGAFPVVSVVSEEFVEHEEPEPEPGPNVFTEVASGGVRSGASATTLMSVRVAPQGGTLLAGTVTATTSVRVAPQGGARLAGSATVTPDPTVYHLLLIGQSNAEGSDGYPALSTAAAGVTPQPLMFSTGIRSGTSGLTSFAPLVESDDGSQNGETIAWGMTRYLATKSGKTILVSCSALDGARYDQLNKGQAIYNNSISQVTAAKNVCAGLGRPYRVLGLCCLHGEADQAFLRTNYDTNLAQWRSDYDADIKAVTGQSEDVLFFFDQQVSAPAGQSGVGTTTATAYRGWLAHKANPSKMAMVGARYLYNGPDTGAAATGGIVHLGRYSYRWHGHRFGRAIHDLAFGAGAWRPVSPVPGQITLSGVTVTANFYVPDPPLVLDFAQVVKNSTLLCGFSFFDDSGSPPAVTAVSVSGPTQLTLTLASAPTGTAGSWRLRGGWGNTSLSGGPIVGANRINLRDSSAETAADGSPLHNWCVIFEEQVV